MKISILVALVVVSFTAVLAAPRSSLKQISLPKFTIPAPNVDNAELIAAVGKAIEDISAALTTASAELDQLLLESGVLPEVEALIQRTEEKAVAVIEAAVAEGLNTPVEQLPALVARTVGELRILISNTAAELILLLGDRAPDLLPQAREVVNRLVAEVEQAIQPVLDLLTPPETKKISPNFDLPELVDALRKAHEETSKALASAKAELVVLLEGSPLLKDVEVVVVRVENQAFLILEAAAADALKTEVGELIGLVERTIQQLNFIIHDATLEIQSLVQLEGPELVEGVARIADKLAEEVRAALQPLIDLISPPESKISTKVNLPELIKEINNALVAIRTALGSADAALTTLLQDSKLLREVKQVVANAERKATETVNAALREALETKLKDLPALVRRTVEDLKAVVNNAALAIQSIVQLQGPDLVEGVARIVEQLVSDVKAAIKPVIDLISPPGSHISPKVNIPELIREINNALAAIRTAIGSADAALTTLLQDSKLLREVQEVVANAERQATETVNAALREALETKLKDLPDLLQRTVEDLQAVVNDAALAIRRIVQLQGPDLVEGVARIVEQLVNDVKAAIKPVIDLITPPGSKAINAIDLPELVALIQVAIPQIQKAVAVSEDGLRRVLEGTSIVEDVIHVVRRRESEALISIELAMAEALETKQEDLPDLIERTIVRLNNLFQAAVSEIQSFVNRAAPEHIREVEIVVATLAVDITEALMPIIEALRP